MIFLGAINFKHNFDSETQTVFIFFNYFYLFYFIILFIYFILFIYKGQQESKQQCPEIFPQELTLSWELPKIHIIGDLGNQVFQD